MTVLPVVRLGHPALRAVSSAVPTEELGEARFQSFLDDLAETCIANNGAGIAAPQVAVNKRVIVVNVDPANPRYPGHLPFPLTIVVNPTVENRSDTTSEDWEGDLSANLRGLVPRAESCVVTGLDREGNDVRFDLWEPCHARVFQHEIDHLDGYFFIDRIVKKETLLELPTASDGQASETSRSSPG